MRFFIAVALYVVIILSNSAFATEKQLIQFTVVPEDSYITYSPLVAYSDPIITKRFDITEGVISVYVFTARCGTKYIQFGTSSFNTDPSTTPYEDFILPEGATGDLTLDTFYASSWGRCQMIYCDSYDLGGTTYCTSSDPFSEIAGSLIGDELIISGVSQHEIRYEFSIKAIKTEPTVSDFPWELLIPILTSPKSHSQINN